MPNPYPILENGERIFSVPSSTIKFGPGSLKELGADARSLKMSNVALFTNRELVNTEFMQTAINSLKKSKINPTLFDEVVVEPTDVSFQFAANFSKNGNFDGYISLGGGSVIDTCKVGNRLATYPDNLLSYVNAPIGGARAVPGPIMPHIACPTTCGTGSEATGVAVFDLVKQHLKTGISSIHLRPTLALVDPLTTHSLPSGVVVSTGFDVLTHAIESFTARPYMSREKPKFSSRPTYQGSNPFSDIGSKTAIQIGGTQLVKAVNEHENYEARHQLMFAATLAGQAFGNAGVHVPHAMSYSVAGLNHNYIAKGYESASPMIPHGISVVLNAPAAFRFTGRANPERHFQAANALGADTTNVRINDGGEILAKRLIEMMQITGLPNGLRGVGYCKEDIPALVKGGYAQSRLLAQAPCPISEEDLAGIYLDAMTYW